MAVAVIQSASGSFNGGSAQIAVLSVGNTGTIVAGAHAEATGVAAVFASAVAGGVELDFTGIAATGTQTGRPTVTAIVHNTGHISAVADAFAGGGTVNTALAFAAGIDVDAAFAGPGWPILNVDIVNSGSSIDVSASASASGAGVASAAAVGIEVDGLAVDGLILNSGLIRAQAFANGGSTAVAQAGGISVAAGTFVGTISNVGGTIVAFASASSASAYGIRVTGYETGYGTGAVGTINVVDSTIWAGVSNDGGLSVEHGAAIDVANASHAIVINFDGEADVFGNIVLSDDDVVNVNGRLYFDGAVNPGGATPVHTGLSADTYPLALGTLNVNGTLTLANNPDLGPASVNVGVFNQADAAAVVFEVRGGDAGHIFAQTANLDGTAVVRLYTGLYNDVTITSAVAALNLNGQWDDVVLDRNYLFFDVDAVYNSGSVDILLSRLPFDSVTGMTPNQIALGGGLDGAFSTSLSGPFGDLAQNLLFQTDAATFLDYLDQLSGAEHGQKVHAELQAQILLRDIVAQQLQTVPEIGVRTDGFSLNSVWVAGFGSWGSQDGNVSAGGYDSNMWGVVGGIDFKVGASGKLGATVGYASGDMEFDRYANTADYSGWNVGLYGRYDAPQFYFQGIGSYGMYDNDVQRNIDVVAIPALASPHRTLLHPDAGINFPAQPGIAATTGIAEFELQQQCLAALRRTGLEGQSRDEFLPRSVRRRELDVRRQRLVPRERGAGRQP